MWNAFGRQGRYKPNISLPKVNEWWWLWPKLGTVTRVLHIDLVGCCVRLCQWLGATRHCINKFDEFQPVNDQKIKPVAWLLNGLVDKSLKYVFNTSWPHEKQLICACFWTQHNWLKSIPREVQNKPNSTSKAMKKFSKNEYYFLHVAYSPAPVLLVIPTVWSDFSYLYNKQGDETWARK